MIAGHAIGGVAVAEEVTVVATDGGVVTVGKQSVETHQPILQEPQPQYPPQQTQPQYPPQYPPQQPQPQNPPQYPPQQPQPQYPPQYPPQQPQPQYPPQYPPQHSQPQYLPQNPPQYLPQPNRVVPLVLPAQPERTKGCNELGCWETSGRYAWYELQGKGWGLVLLLLLMYVIVIGIFVPLAAALLVLYCYCKMDEAGDRLENETGDGDCFLCFF